MTDLVNGVVAPFPSSEGFVPLEEMSVSTRMSFEYLHPELIESREVEKETDIEFINKYLMNPQLLNLIDNELDKKVVGENDSRMVIFLVANMRNVENLSKGTDNLIVNALSGTGKDHVVGAVFDLIPNNEKEELIRTTPKVLAYTRNRKVFEVKK